jgi:hypothetical protein
MAKQTYLKVTLTLMALYAGVMGALMMLFHDAANFVFQYDIIDPMVTRYWGGVLLALSIFYLFIATDPVKYRLFLWVGVFDLGMAMILTIINISLKNLNWWQGMIGVVINPIFIVILLYGLAKPPEGEVLFVAGEDKKANPQHELPPHIVGQHPLDRK